jgi:hypothetical protein
VNVEMASHRKTQPIILIPAIIVVRRRLPTISAFRKYEINKKNQRQSCINNTLLIGFSNFEG